MKKIKMLIMLNSLMGISFILLFFSILFYRYIPTSWQGSYFLYQLHTYSGIVFFLIAFFHIILNWSWIKHNILKR